MTKEKYIGRYLDKKMKKNKLPYGLAYLNLVADYEEVAGKYWERMIREKLKQNIATKHQNRR